MTVAADTTETTVAPTTDAGWDRKRVAMSLVNRHAVAATGTGLIPVPGFDIATLFGIQLNLINHLCDLYGVKFTRQAGLHVVSSLVAGVLPLGFASFTASLMKFIPVIGHWAGGAAVAVNGSAVTYGIGRVMVANFEKGGDLLYFEAAKAKEFFKREVESHLNGTAETTPVEQVVTSSN